jgi:hypothetical protein
MASPLHPDSFTHAFKRFGRQAGLHPSTRLHDVRQAVATELGCQGGIHGVWGPKSRLILPPRSFATEFGASANSARSRNLRYP